MQEINEDEAALYDRQIRLWGIDSQKRLRACKVLIAGLCGLGAEICKNTVLAGVNSVTLLDHANVTEEDLSAQFFLTKQDVGKNRAECSLCKVKQLNPLVEVGVDVEKLEEKREEFFERFDVVCAIGASFDVAVRVDDFCRRRKIKFFAGEVFGFYGYMFSDLGVHEYVEEQVEFKSESKALADGVPNENMRKTKTGWKEIKTVKKVANFAPLDGAVRVEWLAGDYETFPKNASRNFLLFLVCQMFRAQHGRKPVRRDDSDSAALSDIRDSLFRGAGLDVSKLGDEFLGCCYGELSPVCAILGGVISQEIIKAVSQKDNPFNNFFFYNGVSGDGVVESISS